MFVYYGRFNLDRKEKLKITKKKFILMLTVILGVLFLFLFNF